jgi:two-component system phosphate regulon sensor histidine kinase PhoR
MWLLRNSDRRRPTTPFYVSLGLVAAACCAVGLAALQYSTLARAEREAGLALGAGLDAHLIALADQAKRDIVERATLLSHSLSHPAVRQRNLKRLARSFGRAHHREPGVDELFAAFFPRGEEAGPWRVVHFVPVEPAVEDLDGIGGTMVDDPEAGAALRRAWFALPSRAVDTTYSSFAPISTASPTPRQIFFHPVYDPSHMLQQGETQRVGILVLVVDPERFPDVGYYEHLVAAHGVASEGLGRLAFRVSVDRPEGRRDLVVTERPPDDFRERRFAASDGLFPNMAFGAALAERAAADYVRPAHRRSLALAVGGAVLALLGVALTWRAAQSEIGLARAKADFLASVSHELKTPLTAIRAFGDLLRSRRVRDQDRVQHYGELIAVESRRLTGLLDNILEMARAGSAGRRYRLAPADLVPTIRGAVDLVREAAVVHGATIELKLPGVPVWACIAEGAIHQALLNLLSNAVKYGGAGNARIEVSLKVEDAAAVVRVRDHGPGISVAEQRRIFEPFYRGDASAVGAASGTGLGLAVVREIARGHGGDVAVDSAPGQGATFTLRLPLASAETLEEPEGLGTRRWRTSS